MKLVEVTQPTPDVIRLFQEPRQQAGNFALALLNSLGKEKSTNFHNVNIYLESSLGDSNATVEDIGDFQLKIEQSNTLDRDIEADFQDLHDKAQSCLIDLHRSKIKLNDLKISLCRFIIAYESPNPSTPRPYRSVEEWMDAASLSEMRLTAILNAGVDRNLQKLLALFMTFRSIVCSYDGPSVYIRQIENSLASLDALYEKVHLEMEVRQAKKHLVQTRRELSTAKLNLSSLQDEIQEKKLIDERIQKLIALQEKSAVPQFLIIVIAIILASVGIGFYFISHLNPITENSIDGLSQHSCREIAKQLEKSPRYQSQVLIFRKFGEDIYFRANAMTCEKLHRLDSLQLRSLGGLLKVDYAAGNQGQGAYNGNRVLQVKDVGINKLVVKLSNATENDSDYKLKVLEKANTLRAMLEQGPGGSGEDILIVDLH